MHHKKVKNEVGGLSYPVRGLLKDQTDDGIYARNIAQLLGTTIKLYAATSSAFVGFQGAEKALQPKFDAIPGLL